ncbi:MAG: hypothetical protein PHI39_08235 [Kiritimatiellae bacterium]|nr:hypothetical protein [Kiritimatiellia bacterium]
MKTLTLRLVKILAGLVVTLLVLHTVLLVASGLALRNARNELRAAGRPMAPEDIIPKDIPASDNAAPLYESAFALLKSETLDGKDLIHALSTAAREFLAEPESDEKRETLEAVLAHPATVQALDLVAQAATRPGCNFNLQYDLGPMLMMPHVNGMLTVGRSLSARALLEARQGAGNQAWPTLETNLRMADALRDEPALISTLVRVALHQNSLASVRRIAEEFPPDDETTAHLADWMNAADYISHYLLALDGERLFYGEWAFQKFPVWNSNEILSLLGGGGPNCGIWLMDLLLRYRPARQADYALYLRSMHAAAQQAQQPYWETGRQLAPDLEFPWYSAITRLILPALSPARTRMVMLQANARVTRTGLALIRHKTAHGAYPATLADLDPQFLPDIPPDPFTGQPLVYRPEGDGFVLYSLGENHTDDGGTEETKDNRDSKSFDIVWRMPR